MITVERIRREGRALKPRLDIMLEAGDVVLMVVGRREVMVGAAAQLGQEVANSDGMSVVMQKRQGVFTACGMNHTTIAALRATVDRDMRHGVYLQAISRVGNPLPVLVPETQLEHGDVLTLRLSAGYPARGRCRLLRAAVLEQDRFYFLYGRWHRGGPVDRTRRRADGRHSDHARLGRRLSARGAGVRLDARQASDVRRHAVCRVATAEGLRAGGVRRGRRAEFGLAGRGYGPTERTDDLSAGCSSRCFRCF